MKKSERKKRKKELLIQPSVFMFLLDTFMFPLILLDLSRMLRMTDTLVLLLPFDHHDMCYRYNTCLQLRAAFMDMRSNIFIQHIKALFIHVSLSFYFGRLKHWPNHLFHKYSILFIARSKGINIEESCI